MMKYIFRCFSVMLLVVSVVSCSTTKTSKKPLLIEGISESEYLENALNNHAGVGWNALTAKMSLTLDIEGKKTKVNGNMRIKKGEVIQLSIVPFLGIEVARAEITPDGVLVIDRMNKRYVQVSFVELQALAKAKMDFHTLQALFLNEIFLPGREELTYRDASAFDVEVIGKNVRLDVRKAKRFSFSFLTQAPDAQLIESFVGLKGTPYGLQWEYGNFRLLDQKAFPSVMKVFVRGSEKPMNAMLSLSRLSTNSDWETHTKVSSKYERVALGDLLKQLIKK